MSIALSTFPVLSYMLGSLEGLRPSRDIVGLLLIRWQPRYARAEQLWNNQSECRQENHACNPTNSTDGERGD